MITCVHVPREHTEFPSTADILYRHKSLKYTRVQTHTGTQTHRHQKTQATLCIDFSHLITPPHPRVPRSLRGRRGPRLKVPAHRAALRHSTVPLLCHALCWALGTQTREGSKGRPKSSLHMEKSIRSKVRQERHHGETCKQNPRLGFIGKQRTTLNCFGSQSNFFLRWLNKQSTCKCEDWNSDPQHPGKC